MGRGELLFTCNHHEHICKSILTQLNTCLPSTATTDNQFGAFAESYDAHRPSYPPEVFDEIAHVTSRHVFGGSGATVIDVGSGTGRVAIALAERPVFSTVIATDSDARMLEAAQASAAEVAKLHAANDGAADTPSHRAELQFKQCRAESLGVGDGHVDAVTCFQAFHWFDADAALREFARVVRPHGGLFFAGWNDRDLDVPWIRAFEAVIEKHNNRFDHRTKQSDEWLPVLTRGGLFRPVAHGGPHGPQQPWVFKHEVRYRDAEGLLELCRTYSYVENAMSKSQFEHFANDVRALVADAHGGHPFDMPYATKLYALERAPEGGGGRVGNINDARVDEVHA